MRIALAQINPTVGDIAGNTRKIMQFIDRAEAQGAEVVVFPELAVIGYPPKDLLLKADVLDRCQRAVERIAQRCASLTAIVGYPRRNEEPTGRSLRNSAAVCAGGRVIAVHDKSLLPTYDVFDESRYFEPGPRVDVTSLHGRKVGISICEDMWNDRELIPRLLYHDNPISELAGRGAELFINCSASPYVVGKHDFRLKLCGNAARGHGIPLVFVNQVGGNDELVFDGNSCVFDAAGRLIAHARDFEEDLLVVEVDCGPAAADAAASSACIPARHRTGIESVYAALVLGLRDYCGKCGFENVVLGLSGGIDSAVCACLAVAGLGPEHVTGIAMPSRYSSPGSLADAHALAETLGIAYKVISIEDAHAAMERTLAPHFAGTTPGTAEENVQARLRGLIVMSFSNKFGSMLITTGNKSELAVGYCTLYGDMAGGLAIISDVPKMMVYDLARWMNTPACPLYAQCGGPPIPRDSITKPPSAELRPNQTDQDSLPPYEVLDEIIDRYVEGDQSIRRIVAETGIDRQTVVRCVTMIDRNEYKRKQAAPGIKVTGRAFGFGRRMPIAQRYDPLEAEESTDTAVPPPVVTRADNTPR